MRKSIKYVIIGIIIVSLCVVISIPMMLPPNLDELDELDEPILKEFYYIEVYIEFNNDSERNEYLLNDFPYGISWSELYVHNRYLVRTVVFENTPYESTHCHLDFILWKCGLYFGYFRERFGTDELYIYIFSVPEHLYLAFFPSDRLF